MLEINSQIVSLGDGPPEGFEFPPGTPQAIIDRINSAINIGINTNVPKINVHLIFVENTGTEVEEYTLPEKYRHVTLIFGTAECNNGTLLDKIQYSPDINKINLSANTKIKIHCNPDL